MKRIYNKLIKFINNLKYGLSSEELKLPNRWKLNKCFDCNVLFNKDNDSGWDVFREINGKVWSVRICNECLDKQEEEIEKLKDVNK